MIACCVRAKTILGYSFAVKIGSEDSRFCIFTVVNIFVRVFRLMTHERLAHEGLSHVNLEE